MKVTSCLYREERQSLLCEERSEVRAVLLVEHKGKTGHLRMDVDIHKRDADTEYYCDVPGVTADTLANGYDQDPPLYIDEELWNHTPQHTKPTPAITTIVCELGGHKL